MSESDAVRVVRRSPGRIRLHAPSLTAAGGAGVESISALGGVRDVRSSPSTGNLLIEFDPELIDEPQLLALVDGQPASRPPSRSSSQEKPPAEVGWLRAKRSQTFQARPVDCVATLLGFERYPEWQTHVTSVSVCERDKRGRGIRVRSHARVAEREIEFTTRYRFPSPNRIAFEQEGELAAVRGSWAFRSAGAGRTRATCVLEVKPGWRLSLLLRGSLYERIREAGLDYVMDELRRRVESAAA